jgi:4-amino-4-deoxy-L-arabinose transferase-like glycosyltransferase
MSNQAAPPLVQGLGLARAALVGLAVFVFLFLFAGRNDFGRREARNAIAAREMVSSGHYLLPTLGGQPRLEKPPLMYWAIAGTARLFNGGLVSERIAALPSALAGASCCVGVALVTARLIGRKAGLMAAAILATSLGFYKWGRIGQIEMLLTAMVALSVGAFVLWSLQPRRRSLLLLACAFAAAACMTKGPVALVLIFTGVGAWLISLKLAGRRIRGLATLWHLAGIAVFFVLALPWPVAVMLQSGAKEVFLHEVLGRLSGGWQRHVEGPFYYFGTLPWLVAPWIVAWPVIAWRLWKDRATLRAAHAPAIFLALWFLSVFVIFSAVRTKQSFYLLPILPACAMLTAWAINGIRRAERATVALAAAAVLTYLGDAVIREPARRPHRDFADAVREITANHPGTVGLYYVYGDSPTADLQAEMFVYLDPGTQLLAAPAQTPPATPDAFEKLAGTCRHVILNAGHWQPGWGAELPGFRLVLAKEVDREKFLLLSRPTP